jgi:hypothetical protein
VSTALTAKDRVLDVPIRHNTQLFANSLLVDVFASPFSENTEAENCEPPAQALTDLLSLVVVAGGDAL